MPTARESMCCREISAIDNKLQESSGDNPCCITEHEGLDVWVLQTAGFQTQQEFGRHATSGPVHKLVHTMMYICKYIYVYILYYVYYIYTMTLIQLRVSVVRLPHIYRALRHIAYRQLARWCWGYLGQKVRVVLPLCAVCRSRSAFPSDSYVGVKL